MNLSMELLYCIEGRLHRAFLLSFFEGRHNCSLSKLSSQPTDLLAILPQLLVRQSVLVNFDSTTTPDKVLGPEHDS